MGGQRTWGTQQYSHATSLDASNWGRMLLRTPLHCTTTPGRLLSNYKGNFVGASLSWSLALGFLSTLLFIFLL